MAAKKKQGKKQGAKAKAATPRPGGKGGKGSAGKAKDAPPRPGGKSSSPAKPKAKEEPKDLTDLKGGGHRDRPLAGILLQSMWLVYL